MPSWAPPLLRVLVVLLLVAALLLGTLWALQRKLIYFPTDGPLPPAGSAVRGAREVTFTTEDGLSLAAWYVPARGAGREAGPEAGRQAGPEAGRQAGPGAGPEAGGEAAPTVLVAHGNAGDRAVRAPLAAALSARGLAVLLVDYRGYGGNPGSPSEAGLVRDVEAAYRFLTEEMRVPPDRLVYFGESLGTAVATALAARHPPAALVLRSPFVDLRSVGRAHYPYLPLGLLLRDRFPLAERLATVRVPTGIVYGTADTVVPASQSLEVARRAGGPVRVVEVRGANHNDRIFLDGTELIDTVVSLASGATR